ncbi:MAG TPA: right-handed parallel beta-helix repeat-containing protein [Kofleriaceae bacterium]|jgi:hypothetical protein
MTKWTILGVVMFGSVAAHAATFTVTSTADSGTGTLRDAITQANAAGGTNTVTITATGTITLASSLPTITTAMTITGPGAAQLAVTAPGLQGPAFTTAADVTISAMTLTGGDSEFSEGGVVASESGTLTVTDTTFTGNTGEIGGALGAQGPLIVTHCVFVGNGGYGVLYAVGDTSITDTIFDSNTGTAIVFPPAGRTLTIDRSLFTNNTDAHGIAAIQVQGGTANISNTTFSGNIGLQGGDVWTYSDGVVISLVNVTSVNDGAPAILFDHSATVTMHNSIFAGTGARCSGHAIDASSHDLLSDATCGLVDPTDQQNVADLKLGALADNGGPTMTMIPLAGSPAIDAGDGTLAVGTMDQRGLARVAFAAIDIGAVEDQAPVVDGPSPSSVALTVGQPLSIAVTATNPNSAAPLSYQWRKDGSAITGATDATYAVAAVATTDAGTYDVLVTNEGGTVTSDPQTVTVTSGSPDGGVDAGGGGGHGDDGGCGCSAGRRTVAANGGLYSFGLVGFVALRFRRRRRR